MFLLLFHGLDVPLHLPRDALDVAEWQSIGSLEVNSHHGGEVNDIAVAVKEAPPRHRRCGGMLVLVVDIGKGVGAQHQTVEEQARGGPLGVEAVLQRQVLESQLNISSFFIVLSSIINICFSRTRCAAAQGLEDRIGLGGVLEVPRHRRKGPAQDLLSDWGGYRGAIIIAMDISSRCRCRCRFRFRWVEAEQEAHGISGVGKEQQRTNAAAAAAAITTAPPLAAEGDCLQDVAEDRLEHWRQEEIGRSCC